jgi:hypothetical protein
VTDAVAGAFSKFALIVSVNRADSTPPPRLRLPVRAIYQRNTFSECAVFHWPAVRGSEPQRLRVFVSTARGAPLPVYRLENRVTDAQLPVEPVQNQYGLR